MPLGEEALAAPVSLQNSRSLALELSYTSRSWPPCIKFLAMRLPIWPSPMKPTCKCRHTWISSMSGSAGNQAWAEALTAADQATYCSVERTLTGASTAAAQE